jgi:hypothetical protein
MSFPAYDLIISEILAHTGENSGIAVLTVPTSLLKFLLQGRIPASAFDEAAYLRAYPDIADAVAAGQFVNPLQHFLAHGYFEGRVAGAGVVDAAWYLAEYPDVAAAIAAGAFSDAAAHYYARGIREWRAPNAAAVAELQRWKAALSGAPPPLPTTTVGPEQPLRPTVAPAPGRATSDTPAAPVASGAVKAPRRGAKRPIAVAAAFAGSTRKA